MKDSFEGEELVGNCWSLKMLVIDTNLILIIFRKQKFWEGLGGQRDDTNSFTLDLYFNINYFARYKIVLSFSYLVICSTIQDQPKFIHAQCSRTESKSRNTFQ